MLLVSPEHLHVVINHLPIIGLVAAVLPLAVGVVGRRRGESLLIGLVLALGFAGTIPAVMWSGQEAEDGWAHSPAGAAVLVRCLMSVSAGWWIAASGGRINHPELRDGAELVMPVDG